MQRLYAEASEFSFGQFKPIGLSEIFDRRVILITAITWGILKKKPPKEKVNANQE